MSPVSGVLAVVLQEGGGKQGLEAGNMLWLIQRDFLQVCNAAYVTHLLCYAPATTRAAFAQSGGPLSGRQAVKHAGPSHCLINVVMFVQGKTVGAMVADALAEQPNPHQDKDIDQVAAVAELPRCMYGVVRSYNCRSEVQSCVPHPILPRLMA